MPGKMRGNRRQSRRHKVFGGNAEIHTVTGRGRAPTDRARILDWSKGGVLLKVSSPQRRLLRRQEPCLWNGDGLTCTLRLPPHYKDHVVHGWVTWATRVAGERDALHVGVRFDEETTPPATLAALARLLEPRQRSTYSSRVQRLRRA